ncbi:MAG TPA: transcription-repair coupling factor, partial [Clostridiales bacterium]|nr:transcription-repair coupling factor [Clostridiales bacterium]
MKTFTEPLKELKEFNDLREDINLRNLPVQVTGCIDSQKSNLIYGVSKEFTFKVILTSNELKANEIYEDYKLYDKNVYKYPSKDAIFYSADIRGNAITRDRIQVLRRIIEKKPTTIIASLDCGMEKILPLDFLKKKIISISEDSTLDFKTLAKELTQLGYERQAQVENHGEFTIRGGIIDIFPLTEETPYRIELWGDEIDSIRSFDVDSQRSIEQVKELLIYPASEIVLDS